MALEQSDIMGYPITDDRKGSLTLRADHMNYSRAILNSHWHQARQAEPKDYDLSKDPQRTMAFSTYKRIGTYTDGTLPETTYQEQANQVLQKPMFEEKDNHRPMVQMETLETVQAGLDRDTGDPKEGYGSVLPHHNKDSKKHYLDTTYVSDYGAPYPFTRKEEENEDTSQDFEDKSPAYRKMISQFSDTMNHRRSGWNTWQDESGIYANSQYKAQVFPKTETIPERLV